jgi:hypothetical protein
VSSDRHCGNRRSAVIARVELDVDIVQKNCRSIRLRGWPTQTLGGRAMVGHVAASMPIHFTVPISSVSQTYTPIPFLTCPSPTVTFVC